MWVTNFCFYHDKCWQNIFICFGSIANKFRAIIKKFHSLMKQCGGVWSSLSYFYYIHSITATASMILHKCDLFVYDDAIFRDLHLESSERNNIIILSRNAIHFTCHVQKNTQMVIILCTQNKYRKYSIVSVRDGVGTVTHDMLRITYWFVYNAYCQNFIPVV